MFSSLIKKVYAKFIYPFIAAYLKKERPYHYKGFLLTIFPGIFHPAFFFSTKYFYSFINRLMLEGKHCLEVGCGSGLLSLLMASKKARVTAIDIQERAIANTRVNFEKNIRRTGHDHELIQSDLFDKVAMRRFDYIIINPPYYFTNPKKETEQAWFCGENGEYFIKLFKQLGDYIHPHTKVFMILAENCEINRIKTIASKNNFHFNLVDEKKLAWEKNYIFEISLANAS